METNCLAFDRNATDRSCVGLGVVIERKLFVRLKPGSSFCKPRRNEFISHYPVPSGRSFPIAILINRGLSNRGTNQRILNSRLGSIERSIPAIPFLIGIPIEEYIAGS